MKFKLVKPNCKNVGAYGVENISTDDVINLTGRQAEKAKNNPDFSEVKQRRVKKNGNSSGIKK